LICVDRLSDTVQVVGRYAIHDVIASGGSATVHLGRFLGPVGFTRVVAIKRLHPNLAKDPEFVAMLLDEARIVARIRHPNVVQTLDVVATGEELLLVLDYVEGQSLSNLLSAVWARSERVPVGIAAAIATGVLHGLHAAHEARDEQGAWLAVVHRDVSPQNVMVGSDGVARILDFGVAKARVRLQSTREGQFKGKLAYTAPEHLRGHPVSRATDLYAVGVLLWEALAGRRLFGDQEFARDGRAIVPPSQIGAAVPPALDDVVMRALAEDPAARFASAHEMAIAIERAVTPSPISEVSAWVDEWADEALLHRQALVALMEERILATEVGTVPAARHAPQVPLARWWIPRKTRLLLAGAALGALLALIAIRASERATVVPAEGAASLAVDTRVHRSPEPAGSAPVDQVDVDSAPASTPPKAHSVSAAPAAPAHRPRWSARAAPNDNCSPPFIVDDVGTKRYKAECFH
jgi:tRNA A-37 threonylcarbamoyl transferase component Bud32